MQPYFALLPAYSSNMGGALIEKVNRWYQGLPSLRPYQRARKNRQLYYGLPSSASPFDVSVIGQMGEQGELSAIHNNRFHHLGQRVLSLAVQEDFGWQPQGANADTLSQEEAILAASVLEYEKRNQSLTALRTQIMEMALLDGWAHWSVRWDPGEGPQYDQDPESGAAVYEGRLQVKAHPWWRCVIDISRQDAKHDWIIVVDFLNKWDVAERFAKGEDPKLQESYRRIVSLGPDNKHVLQWLQTARGWSWSENQSPLIPVYSFFHKPTRSVPQGRMVVFTDDGSILQDGPTPYGEALPVYRTSAGEMLDTPFGNTPMTNIAALQQVLNMTMSTALTNTSTFGIINLLMRAGSNYSRSQFDGMNVWEVEDPKQDVSTLDLLKTAPEIYNFMGIVKEEMSTEVGLNAVSLGQQTQQMSGALAALLDSKSQQAQSIFIAQGNQMVADMGTAIIDRYKRFAKAPRALEVIAGSGRAYMLKDFVGDRLNGISRVTVEVRSGLMSTTAGKLDFIEKLAQIPPEAAQARSDLYRVYKTGNLDTAMLSEETRDLLIRQENDLIARGIPPPVRVTDDHRRHIIEHGDPLANPTTRMDERVAAAHDEHVQQHIDMLRNTDPALLQLLGQEPLPPLMPPGMPTVGPDGAPMEGPPPPEGAVANPPDMGGSTEPPMPDMPNQPRMPTLPTTGETYQPPGPPPLA